MHIQYYLLKAPEHHTKKEYSGPLAVCLNILYDIPGDCLENE